MNHISIHKLIKNRYALSTVVTTLIILVVSILLASVLTFFATNVVSTRVQEESLYVSKQHIWVEADGTAQGAIMVTNNGGRDVVINKVSVRGQPAAWSNVFYANAISTDDLTTELSYIPAITPGTTTFGGLATAASSTTDNLILPSGNTVVIYISSPDSIGATDIGLTVGIGIHSAQAVYYSEVNIQAAP